MTALLNNSLLSFSLIKVPAMPHFYKKKFNIASHVLFQYQTKCHTQGERGLCMRVCQKIKLQCIHFMSFLSISNKEHINGSAMLLFFHSLHLNRAIYHTVEHYFLLRDACVLHYQPSCHIPVTLSQSTFSTLVPNYMYLYFLINPHIP